MTVTDASGVGQTVSVTMREGSAERRYGLALTAGQVRRFRLPGYPVGAGLPRAGSVGYVYECGGA